MGGVGHPSVPQPVGADDAGAAAARKRTVAMAGFESSPGSIEDVDDSELREEKKRQPVKRACNECRQQKVSSSMRSDPGGALSLVDDLLL